MSEALARRTDTGEESRRTDMGMGDALGGYPIRA